MICLEKPDLTHDMGPEQDAEALSEVVPAMPEVAPSEAVLPELPDDWVPPDTVIMGVAERDDDGTWEVVMPLFTIVAMGDNLHDALHEAGELLDDYLRICYAEGRTFEESYRPIPARWMLPMVARGIFQEIVGTVSHGRVSRRQTLRVPLDHATC